MREYEAPAPPRRAVRPRNAGNRAGTQDLTDAVVQAALERGRNRRPALGPGEGCYLRASRFFGESLSSGPLTSSRKLLPRRPPAPSRAAAF